MSSQLLEILNGGVKPCPLRGHVQKRRKNHYAQLGCCTTTGSGDPGADVHRPGRRVHRRGDGHGKARHFRPGGTPDATARDACWLGDVTTAEILETTGIPTPLGEVVILRARSAGNVQLAGPSITSQLRRYPGCFFELGEDKSIIDGALGRKSQGAGRLPEAWCCAPARPIT